MPIMIFFRSFSQSIAPEILEAQAQGTVTVIWLNKQKRQQTINIGGYRLDISIRNNRTNTEMHNVGYGLVMVNGKDEFTIAGTDLQINFYPLTLGPAYAEYETLDEGKYVDGKWVAGRRLNGDDIMLNYHIADEAAAKRTGSVVRTLGDVPQIIKVKLYRFE